MDIDQAQGSSTWREKRISASSSERSDSPTYSTKGSPLLSKSGTHIPTYISRMDSDQYNLPGPSSGHHHLDETQELVRENEELRTAIAALQEQMAEINRSNHPPAQEASVPSTNQGVHGQEALNDWILRQQLKKHSIPKFLGSIDHEAVLAWTDAVTHFALLAGLDNNATITAAWTAVAPEVLVWFRSMLEADYNYKFVPAAANYPFSWDEVKVKFVHRYSPAFAVEAVWNRLEVLKRGTGPGALQEFNTKFLDLARLAGKNRQNTQRGDRLYMIYIKKMTARERDILSAIAISAHRSNKTITLDDAMAVTDDQAVTQGLTGGTTSIGTTSTPAPLPFTSSSHPTAPAPMDLSAITGRYISSNRRDRNICTRCGGKGHWSASCGTKPDWKAGDPVNGYRARGGQGHRSGGFARGRGRSHGGSYNIVDGYEETEATGVEDAECEAMGDVSRGKPAKN